MPCFTAFNLEAARPSRVLGPVDFWALARLAARRSSEVVFIIISNGYGFRVCGFAFRVGGTSYTSPQLFRAKNGMDPAIKFPERDVPNVPGALSIARTRPTRRQSWRDLVENGALRRSRRVPAAL